MESPGTTSHHESDDLSASLEQIAASISELSEGFNLPLGYTKHYDTIASDGIDFESARWLTDLLSVQHWLNLDEDVDATTHQNGTAAAKALFRAMGGSNYGQPVEDEDGTPRLTEFGAQALANRLELATHLRKVFDETLESSSRAEATEAWADAWEASMDDTESTGPIKAKTDVWSISNFASKAARRKMNLSPSYQRGDVWPNSHSQSLIVSILRGIPLPSIILLRPKVGGKLGAYEVVDGKQRLTAILRFMGRHPEALRRVEEAQSLQPSLPYKKLFKEDYRGFQRLWKNNRSEKLSSRLESEYYFPFRLPNSDKLPSPHLAGKYYADISEEYIEVGGESLTIRDLFEETVDYKIPLIEYTEATPRQIHEVFHLYNRQGKHLNAEEIRNALYHEVDLMRLVLAASGDNPNFEELAPAVPKSKRWKLIAISESLGDYGFGVARYRRTKMLSWVLALALAPSEQEDGTLRVRSTAKQIDFLLKSIESGYRPQLAERDTLESLVDDLHAAIDAHAACAGSFAPAFMDDRRGEKWQELQLAASLLAFFFLSLVSDDPIGLVESRHAEFSAFTGDHLRPEKTQNKTQWGFIGEVALGLLEVLEIDLSIVSDKLRGRYGADTLPTLRAARSYYTPRT